MAIRYPGAITDGLTEELVCSLERPYKAAELPKPSKQRFVTGSYWL